MTPDNRDDGLPFYHPDRQPATSRIVPASAERLWQLRRDHVTWSAELVFRGESYGWECRVLRNGEFTISRRFLLREHAERWGGEQRAKIDGGGSDA